MTLTQIRKAIKSIEGYKVHVYYYQSDIDTFTVEVAVYSGHGDITDLTAGMYDTEAKAAKRSTALAKSLNVESEGRIYDYDFDAE